MSDSLTKIIPAKRLEELRAESREIEVDVVFEDEADDTMEDGLPPVVPNAAASSHGGFTGALADENEESAPPSPLRLPTPLPSDPATLGARGSSLRAPIAERSEPPLSGNSLPSSSAHPMPLGSPKGKGAPSFPPSVPRPAVAPRPPALPRPSASPPSVPKKA